MNINVFGHTRNRVTAKLPSFPSQKQYDSEVGSDTWGEPQTNAGRGFLKDDYKNLLKMSDWQLLSKMWGHGGLALLDSKLIPSKALKQALETQFRSNSTRELTIRLSKNYWSSSLFNNQDDILTKITKDVQQALENGRWANSSIYRVDCSFILDNAKLSFRNDVFNPSLTIAMGGVQEVSISTIFVKEEKHSYGSSPNFGGSSFGGSAMDSLNYTHKDYVITLEIKLRDWFGVDEDDFAANNYSSRGRAVKSLVTKLGREELTAFWILQHQRGYKPFVWNAVFHTDIRVHHQTRR